MASAGTPGSTLPALAAIPGEAWRSRLRGMPDAERRRALAEADRLAGLGGEELERALAAYVALEADLDPAEPAGRARVRRLLDAGSSDPALERVYRRAFEVGLGDPEREWTAALVAGQHAVRRGDVAGAEGLYRGVLAATRGSGTRSERAALANLARMCLDGQREYEALVLARRAEALMGAAGDAWGLAITRVYQSTVFRALEDWGRLRAILPAIEGLLPRLEPLAVRRVRLSLDESRATLSIHDGDAEAALAAADAALRLGRTGGLEFDERLALRTRADALLAAGRAAEAEEAVAWARTLGPDHDRAGCHLRALVVRCRLAREGPTAAADAAQPLLDDLARTGPAALGPGMRVLLASVVGRCLRSVRGAEAACRRAYDVAAGAALERLSELDRFMREMPHEGAASSDDLAVFADARARTLEEQREMHAAVARLHAAAAREGRVLLPMFPTERGHTCVCAWCQRVRTTDGVWLSIQQFLPLQLEGPVHLTHGICADCAPRLAAEIAAHERR